MDNAGRAFVREGARVDELQPRPATRRGRMNESSRLALSRYAKPAIVTLILAAAGWELFRLLIAIITLD